MLQPGRADLEDAFHDTTLERGWRYARERRVCDVRSEALGETAVRLQATVQGSEAAPYEVEVTIQRRGRQTLLTGRCTCPIGDNCKHAAAALIAAYALQPPLPAVRAGDDGAPHAAPAAPRPSQHAYWIERVRALYAPPALAAERKQPLAYAIEREPYGPRPVVRPLIGNVRKDGSLCPLRFAPDDVAAILRNRPQYLAEQDEPLLRALAPAADAAGAGGRVLTRDAALLRRIVEQGLAVTRRSERWADYAPLRFGAPRAATACWTADAPGRQRFALRVDPQADALALEGLWYLDAARGEFGVLQADVDAPLAAVLLAAPPVAPAETGAVARELSAALAKALSAEDLQALSEPLPG